MKLRQFFQTRALRHAQIASTAAFRHQPIYCFDYEISIEEAKRRFGYVAPEGSIGCHIGHTVYQPMEVDVHV